MTTDWTQFYFILFFFEMIHFFLCCLFDGFGFFFEFFEKWCGAIWKWMVNGEKWFLRILGWTHFVVNGWWVMRLIEIGIVQRNSIYNIVISSCWLQADRLKGNEKRWKKNQKKDDDYHWTFTIIIALKLSFNVEHNNNNNNNGWDQMKSPNGAFEQNVSFVYTINQLINGIILHFHGFKPVARQRWIPCLYQILYHLNLISTSVGRIPYMKDHNLEVLVMWLQSSFFFLCQIIAHRFDACIPIISIKSM